MLTKQIPISQIEQRTRSWLYSSVADSWLDVGDETCAAIEYTMGNSGEYSTIRWLQLTIPGSALVESLAITSILLKARVYDGQYYAGTTIGAAVTNSYQVESGLVFYDIGAFPGNSVLVSKDITSYCTGINKAANWYIQLRIEPGDNDGLTLYSDLNGSSPPYLEITYDPQPCAAPALTVSPVIAETNPTLSGSGAADGAGNPITGYEIQCAESADGVTWGSWTAEKIITTSSTGFSTPVPVPSTRGYSRKWRVRTLGEAGEAYYSDWVESGTVRRNSAPSAPASVSASPAIYEAGGITVSWPAAADIDDNVAAYELQRAASTDGEIWSAWADVHTNITGIYYVDSPAIARGAYIKYRLRAKDAFGITGGYTETAAVRRNQAPPAPTIQYPQAGKTIYNPRPRILVVLGTEPDGQTQMLIAAGYAPGSAGPYTSGQKIILRKALPASAGTVSVTVTAKDAQNAVGPPSEISTTYAALPLTDTVTSGRTRIKAVHITELRTAIDTVRAYYGMPEYAWAEPVAAGRTSMRGWKSHIAELRAAVDEIITFVNAWDPSAPLHKIDSPVWSALADRPSAAALNRIRTILPTL